MLKTLKVDGMHCKSCEMLLNDVVSEIAGVKVIDVQSKTGKVTFEYEAAEAVEQVKKAIEKEGYRVV